MICAVVATRNEPEIGPFLKRLRNWVDGVIVCDESNDGGSTAWNAHKAGAAVLSCSGGIGPSLMAGWQHALDSVAYDRIVQIDAGGSHNPEDIPKLLACDTDIAIGSRFMFSSVYEGRRWRSLASQAYAFTMDRRSGEHVTDWTSGFRCFTTEAVDALLGYVYRASMHGWQAEVLLRAFDAGMTVDEVPIRYRAGESSFRVKHAIEAVQVR